MDKRSLDSLVSRVYGLQVSVLKGGGGTFSKELTIFSRAQWALASCSLARAQEFFKEVQAVKGN